MNIEILIWAFTCAGLCSLLNFAFQKEGIFRFYLPFISKLINWKHYKENKHIKEYEYWIAKGSEHYLFYPLGYCLYCFSIWLSVFFYLIIYLILGFNLLLILPFSFCTFAFVLLINK